MNIQLGSNSPELTKTHKKTISCASPFSEVTTATRLKAFVIQLNLEIELVRQRQAKIS